MRSNEMEHTRRAGKQSAPSILSGLSCCVETVRLKVRHSDGTEI